MADPLGLAASCSRRSATTACRASTFPGDPDSYPGRDDVVAYLTDYAQRFELPVEFNSRVRSVRPRDGGGFLVELADRTYEADQVVVATGPFQVPFTPAIAADLSTEVVQLHSSDYRSPGDLPAGAVLVVGGGNTGYQIAAELAQSREVHLAVGARQTPLPQRILGRDLFRYLEATGLMSKTVTSRIGQRMKDKETLIGSSPRRRAQTGHQDAAARDRRPGLHGDVRRRLRGRRRRCRLGDGLPARPLVRRVARLRRPRAGQAPARRHRAARSVLPRPALAAHARFGAARLGQGRRASSSRNGLAPSHARTPLPARRPPPLLSGPPAR